MANIKRKTSTSRSLPASTCQLHIIARFSPTWRLPCSADIHKKGTNLRERTQPEKLINNNYKKILTHLRARYPYNLFMKLSGTPLYRVFP